MLKRYRRVPEARESNNDNDHLIELKFNALHHMQSQNVKAESNLVSTTLLITANESVRS